MVDLIKRIKPNLEDEVNQHLKEGCEALALKLSEYGWNKEQLLERLNKWLINDDSLWHEIIDLAPDKYQEELDPTVDFK